MPFGLIAIAVVWGVAIKLWITDGAKIPLVFIGLWFAGLFGFRMLHWPGGILLAFESILAVTLLLVERYKSGL